MASQVESIKWVPGTSFLVDGFRFQNSLRCKTYFLTHCHADHTTGLTKAFDGGLIYCSYISYKILTLDMGLRPQVLRPLELNTPTVIDGTEVTAIDANHCPGAVCFLFKLPNGKVVFHTGDFRWCSEMHGEALAGLSIDILLLDTTYLQPKWKFPAQKEAVTMMAQLMEAEYTLNSNTLFVCMSYHIGKERAYFGAAALLGWRIWVPPNKARLLKILDLPVEWMNLLVDKPEDGRLHVLGMGQDLHVQTLADRIKGTSWKRVVLVRPTGWSFKSSGNLERREDGCVVTVGIPYSEHSSYTELRDCVATLRPKRIIPTVNASDATKSRALVDQLADVMDLSQDRSRLDCYFMTPKPSHVPPTNLTEVAEAACDLSAIDIDEQQQLWNEAKKRPRREGGQRTSRASIRSYFVQGKC